MEKKLVQIQVLGTSFSIRTSEDPEYLQQLVRKFSDYVEEVKKSAPHFDPLKIAILAGLSMADEWTKERSKKGTALLSIQDAELAGKITDALIESMDQVINTAKEH